MFVAGDSVGFVVSLAPVSLCITTVYGLTAKHSMCSCVCVHLCLCVCMNSMSVCAISSIETLQ